MTVFINLRTLSFIVVSCAIVLVLGLNLSFLLINHRKPKENLSNLSSFSFEPPPLAFVADDTILSSSAEDLLGFYPKARQSQRLEPVGLSIIQDKFATFPQP